MLKSLFFKVNILGNKYQLEFISFSKNVCDIAGIVIDLCANVTVTPEDNKITVFKKGNSQISKTSIPKGGQLQPIKTEGFKAI